MKMANAMHAVRSEEMRLKKNIEGVQSVEIDTQK